MMALVLFIIIVIALIIKRALIRRDTVVSMDDNFGEWVESMRVASGRG